MPHKMPSLRKELHSTERKQVIACLIASISKNVIIINNNGNICGRAYNYFFCLWAKPTSTF